MMSAHGLGRIAFVAWTAGLLVAAYLALRVILITTEGYESSFPSGWQFLDPLGLITSDGESLMLTIIVHLALTIALAFANAGAPT